MATSQNGYEVITDREDCKVYYVNGVYVPLRDDDTGYVLADFLERYDEKVEPLGRTETFGWSYRRISGSNDFSNHASATAVDHNSAQHPYGATGTFTDEEEKALRKILDLYDGVLRWGGDYRGTKDEMHTEIVKPYDEVRLVARRLRRGNLVYLSRLVPGKRNFDVYLLKRRMAKRGLYQGSMTNYFGKGLREAYKKYQESLGYTGINADGVPGKASLESLGFRVK